MYLAMVGTSIVEQTETLAQMRVVLKALCRPGWPCNDQTAPPEDVVVWEDGRRVVLVVTADGRTVEMDGQSITWQWPPTVPPATDDVDARLRGVFLTRKPRKQ